MKKLLSALLSLAVVISAFGVAPFQSLAYEYEKDYPVNAYSVGDSFEVSVKKDKTSKKAFAIFIPEKTDFYEFVLSKPYDSLSIEMEIRDINNQRVDSKLYPEDGSQEALTVSQNVCAKLNAGEKYYFIVRGDGEQAYKSKVKIKKHKHNYVEKIIPAEYNEPLGVFTDGYLESVCYDCNHTERKLRAYCPDKIVITNCTYNGSYLKPSVKVYDRMGRLISSDNYKIVCDKNKRVGAYTFSVSFRGESYKGAMVRSYTIKPQKTSITSISAKSKGFSVKWKKKTAQVTGYQLQYSTSKSFKSKATKTITITKNSTSSKTIKNLKAGKKYYVRVRTYKKSGYNKYYSGWSATKSVTTKK